MALPSLNGAAGSTILEHAGTVIRQRYDIKD